MMSSVVVTAAWLRSNPLTVAWYLNHSKTPNVGCDKDYIFSALRDIKEGEELTADYHTYNEFADANWV
jgi:SET domain-containing protein